MTQGEACRKARIAKGQTQAQVAQALGMPRTSYCQLENGKRKALALEVAALCEMWGIPYNNLFTHAKERNQ